MNLHAPALSTPDNHHVIVHKYEYGSAKHPLLSIHRRWAISKITTLQEKANYHGMPGPCSATSKVGTQQRCNAEPLDL